MALHPESARRRRAQIYYKAQPRLRLGQLVLKWPPPENNRYNYQDIFGNIHLFHCRKDVEKADYLNHLLVQHNKHNALIVGSAIVN